MPGRSVRVALVLAVAVAGSGAGAAAAHAGPSRCPVLVLGAMPVEIDAVLAHAHVNPTPAYTQDGKGFWSGTVEGAPAVLALTGIGLQNAHRTTAAAFAHFGCFSAVVFSGTSGGDSIGDVMVPARWTQDGRHFLATSDEMLAVLHSALRLPVPLEQSTPTGDPSCDCSVTGFKGVPTAVTVQHKPVVEVGGTGLSSDGFGGRALPCTPAASDVFGCWPCPLADSQTGRQATDLATTAPPFLEPSFFLGYGSASAAPPGSYVSEDMETAAVFAVAAAHRVPFIGFRAASDGGGDPLHLPGFPAEFFVYRQLAADNAASVAAAFLREWHAGQG